ncbi:hypothetical protein FORC066_2361 [Yersinia enterocolitica]|nr:hypothetical protein FORC066_2361 [Yersinia enterocolitica]
MVIKSVYASQLFHKQTQRRAIIVRRTGKQYLIAVINSFLIVIIII